MSLLTLVQALTARIQIKGAATMLFKSRKLFRHSPSVYRCYNCIDMKIDEDVLYQWWYTVNYSSFDVLKLLERYLRPGDAFVDVGANIGFLSLNAARLVGGTGRVIAVEPQQAMANQIRENAAANRIGNVTIVEAALSDEVGRANFNIATSPDLSRLDNRKGSTFGMEPCATQTVMKTTLDNLVDEQLGGVAPRLVKVDVEGHEYHVLQGAERILEQQRSIFVLEINRGALLENDVRLSDITKAFKAWEYKSYWIESHYSDWIRFTRQPTLCQIEDSDSDNTRSGDIIVFPPNVGPTTATRSDSNQTAI